MEAHTAVRLIRADSGMWVEGRGYRKKPLLDAADLAQKGALVQLVSVPPHTRVGPHLHRRATEVFHILAGSGRMRIGDHDVALVIGDTVTCEPGEVHDARNDDDAALTYIVFKTNWDPADTTWDP
jgi:mannose-6-phosphate isomerase-like protein (cupin superfamily)